MVPSTKKVAQHRHYYNGAGVGCYDDDGDNIIQHDDAALNLLTNTNWESIYSALITDTSIHPTDSRARARGSRTRTTRLREASSNLFIEGARDPFFRTRLFVQGYRVCAIVGDRWADLTKPSCWRQVAAASSCC